jgi:UDP-N-acetylglucosamine 2-epimerase (non-hydrolysing)
MSKTIRLAVVAGARPNFMKIAPLLKALESHNSNANAGEPRFEWKLIHTGQHYDARMSDIFFSELGIPAPDINLEVGSGSHAVQTGAVMTAFEPVCQELDPDWVIVVGDVNSTLACTLVAAKLGNRVAHIEAGLRSYDRTMPEEINRVVTDALADLLLTPSEDANENLMKEGIPAEKIRLVGNIMIDSVVSHVSDGRDGGILEELALEDRGFVYVTLHRPSNVDNPDSLGAIVRELSSIGAQWPVVFPIHPRTRGKLQEFGLAIDRDSGVRLLDPIGYHDSLALTQHARCVLTDSGGLQEETTYFQTPCLTLRPNTERPITITHGSNRLTSTRTLRTDFKECLEGDERSGCMPPLWDGKTAERIVQCLLNT